MLNSIFILMDRIQAKLNTKVRLVLDSDATGVVTFGGNEYDFDNLYKCQNIMFDIINRYVS